VEISANVVNSPGCQIETTYNVNVKNDIDLQIVGGIEWGKWLEQVGRCRTTGFLWRKKGPNGEPPRIKTLNIDGKNYLRAEEIKRFWDRAEAGEFAKTPVVPAKGKRAKSTKA